MTTKGGRFLPGHDAKLKKSLIDSAISGSKRAKDKLEKLGWIKFLIAKQGSAGKDDAKPEARQRKRLRHGAEREENVVNAAKAAKEFAPTLDPPLSEETARILGFGGTD